MANLIRRNEGTRDVATPSSAAAGHWDPFRMMREMLRWDPFRELDTGAAWEGGFAPTFDVKETKDAYMFRADLPGVKEQDLEVSLTGNRLTISGHREQEQEDQNDRYFASERTYGSFSRSFTLPAGVDQEHVQADMKNGVLTLTVPKRPEVQPRRIPLGDQGGGGGEKAKA
jgi:HSP20 family protein